MHTQTVSVIAADHPSFAGHFPGMPILPGVVLLDETIRVIERCQALDLTQWRITTAKFLEVVRPGDALTVEHTAPLNGTIRFTIRVANRSVATGTLSAAAPDP